MMLNINGTDSIIIIFALLESHLVLYFADVIHNSRKQHAYFGV